MFTCFYINVSGLPLDYEALSYSALSTYANPTLLTQAYIPGVIESFSKIFKTSLLHTTIEVNIMNKTAQNNYIAILKPFLSPLCLQFLFSYSSLYHLNTFTYIHKMCYSNVVWTIATALCEQYLLWASLQTTVKRTILRDGEN